MAKSSLQHTILHPEDWTDSKTLLIEHYTLYTMAFLSIIYI